MTDGYVVKATPSGENTYLEKPALEFVNDWSELEAAVAEISSLFIREDGSDTEYVDILPSWEGEAWKAAHVIKEYVPRLLTQYASLLEMSYLLTDLVKEQLDAAPKAGLYVPDHR